MSNEFRQFTPEELLDILELRIKDLALVEDDPDAEAAFILTMRNVVMENNELVKDRENNKHSMSLFKHMIDIMTKKFNCDQHQIDEFLDEAQIRIDEEKKKEKETLKILKPIERDEKPKTFTSADMKTKKKRKK